ncbi:DeoR/GlpR family DNA-binding transcription regulator [Agrococcus sp. SGAir0287]|uniref:DeoR/GlpR family DNA-binding transcription regulator n=1 Tax=Agrococcus sp. SGAir0287 TaxID=2070347 RepID=UPI0015865EBD|nr:DeoR/GlpR family DNA-binding transcription regulator [Agrococcus sp. SGAir0287]
MLDREALILEALDVAGAVQVTELASTLGVSAVTVRKDLEQLERRRLLRRIRGGAVPMRSSVEGAYGERMREEARVKKAIGQVAAQLVQDGDVVALDSSTTAHAVGVELLDRRDLVVVTQSLPMAMLFLERSNAEVVVPGGVLRRQSASLVGTGAEHLVGRGRIAVGIFGCIGLSVERGLLELAPDEAAAKRTLVDACDRVIGVLAAPKAAGFGYHAFASAQDLSTIITDDRVGDQFVADWEGVGVQVTRVAAPASISGPTSVPATEARASTPSPKEHP